ncbi:MAG: LamG domain-containing protein [Victivallales bacterium]|nr:LamG domain-containing protein [Victivallales bacterium]
MKRILQACLVFGLALGGLAQEYVKRTVEEKCQAKDLTFLVTFDNRTVNADFAKGDKFAIGDIRNANLGLRGIVGFDGQQAFQPETGEMLRFPVEGNIDPHKGTVIFWVAGMDYAPKDELTDGKVRGNISFAHLVFDNGGRQVYYQFYSFKREVFFEWWSSEEPHGWGTYGRTTAACRGIRKGQWFQLAATWDDSVLCLYLNGKKCAEQALPGKVVKTADIRAENNDKSFIGVKSPFWGDKHEWATAIDDFAVYSRPLSALEIQNQYNALLKDKTGAEVKEYSIVLNGVDTGHGDKIDRLEVEFDFAALNAEAAKQLKEGKLEVAYELIAPNGEKRQGKWTFQENGPMTRMLSGVTQVGDYTVNTAIGKNKVSASIYRPDYSWIGNGYGDEDEVPPMWRDFSVKGRTVTLWNRVYRFGEGPLPVEVTCYGSHRLLAQPPRLLIDGQEPKWRAGETEQKVRLVVFRGTGSLGKAKIAYTTTVEYDGMIKFDWTIDGEPDISSMNLEWQVAPENHQFLMTPTLNEGADPAQAFPYPKTSGSGAAKMLWFVSEGKGGFAYTMVNDANWRYAAEKPVLFADKKSGECRVELINQRTSMPQGADYCALFIATPVRPLPAENRMLRLDGGGYRLIGSKNGFKGVCQHLPLDPDFSEMFRNYPENRISIYGAIGSLTTNDPEAAYLHKYVEMPGAYKYVMNFMKPLGNGEYETIPGTSQPFCTSCCVGDYLLYCQHHLYQHPLADRVWQVYYDLAGDGLCGNRLHGCEFEDKFGRTVRTFDVLSKRDVIRRTLVYAHKHGKTLMVHAQRDFVPFQHGMIDYWYPGEQHNGLLARNPYGYVDELSDNLYRSEFNRDVLGVGVIHLPALLQANSAYSKHPEYTEAMLGMMMVHDVETCRDWCSSAPMLKCWDILSRYGVGSPDTQCHLYYVQKAVTSANPEVRVTYYQCPQGRYVLVLQNKDVRPAKTTIDLSQIQKGPFTALDEYRGQEIPVQDGKFGITVPARQFRLVCFPAVPRYPIRDDCERLWDAWQKKRNTWFRLSAEGVGGSRCLEMKTDDQPSGCFTRNFYIHPGRTYTLRVKARHTRENEKFSLALQGRIGAGLAGTDYISRKYPSTLDWSDLELVFKVPVTGKWGQCDGFMLTMGGTGANSSIFFDDFSIEEKE